MNDQPMWDDWGPQLDGVVDPECYDHWKRVCAAMPPMTQDEIAIVGLVLRRIDARRKAP